MTPNQFPTTTWTLIRAVGSGGMGHANEDEMNRFIESYWKPVFRFIRAHGYSNDRAEDLTQSFFLDLMNKNWVGHADRERGRFRTFLLSVLKRFLSDQGTSRARRQMQFESNIVNVASLMTDADRSFEPSTNITPDRLFMSEWANAVVDVTCRRVQQWCDEAGHSDWYALFEVSTRPATAAKPLSQRAAAEKYGLTREQVRHALRVTKELFIRLFRDEISEQLANASDVDEEARELEGYLRP